MRNKKIIMGTAFILLAGCMFLQGCGGNEKGKKDYTPYFSDNPSSSQLNLEYTYVEIGEYPQTRIKNQELTEEIIQGEYNTQGIGTVAEQKIYRMEYGDTTEYYRMEPIRWRIMECNEETVMLWSDCIIDAKAYDDFNLESGGTLSWSDSELRAWLNEEFYEQAFSEEEKNSIVAYEYENYDSNYYGVYGVDAEKKKEESFIDTTTDFVSLLDYYTMYVLQVDCPYKINGTDPIQINPDGSLLFGCKNTDYAWTRFKQGLREDSRYYDRVVQGYWSRTPIKGTDYCVIVDKLGPDYSCNEESKMNQNQSVQGVRPVIVVKRDNLEKYIVENNEE